MPSHAFIARAVRNRSGERGSAYLFVLLGLLILTVIGLSLVVVTQTEAQIGGAEKSATRIFFGADSGLQVQLGLHFLETKPTDNQFTLGTKIIAASNLTEVVDVSPFYPNSTGPCALCSVNVGNDRYWVNNFAVNARAQRYDVADCPTPTPQGVKLLSQMFLIQPESQQGGGIDESIRTFDRDIAAPTLIGGSSSCVAGLTTIRY